MLSTTRLLIAATLLVTAGCQQHMVKQPEKVYIQVDKKQKLPPDLLKDCPIEAPKNRTVEEAVRVAAARKEALENCNADKAALRKIDK